MGGAYAATRIYTLWLVSAINSSHFAYTANTTGGWTTNAIMENSTTFTKHLNERQFLFSKFIMVCSMGMKD